MDEARLCYIDGCWAYFTTQDLASQWGDDWNDKPYQFNAGRPYEFHEIDHEHGRKPWQIVRLAFTADLEAPCDWVSVSVDEINRGDVPWLRSPDWSKQRVRIMAGTTLREFIGAIRGAGGVVYLSGEEAE
ncbi:MAG: hypothetical protein AB1760_00105 [Pseudomonadota bacterium]